MEALYLIIYIYINIYKAQVLIHHQDKLFMSSLSLDKDILTQFHSTCINICRPVLQTCTQTERES